MKLSGFFLIVFFTGLIISCSPIYSVSFDSDENIDLVKLSTYNWMPIPKEANINNLDEARIKNAVNAELKAKGLKLTSNNPDFLIAADIITKEKLRITQWGYPYYYSYRLYDGLLSVDSYQYQEGTFILDFVKPASKNLIWQGSARVALDYADTPEKRDRLIKEAMQKILQNFPSPSG
jgi:hypothetical protein